MPTTDTLTVALIGAGNIANRHLANLEYLNNNRVTAICDIDEARAQQFASRVGASVYTDFTNMFERESGLDAVILCTPPTIRKEIFELAVAHEVAIYCEKPPANTVEEARKIADLVRNSHMICSVGFHMRYSPAVDRFRALTAGRAINIVQSSFLSTAALTRSLEPWFFIQEKSGGHIMDQAIHVIDLLRYVVGDISHVQTFGNNVLCPKADDFTIEDTTCTNLRFVHGASGSHIHSWATSRGGAEIRIMGGDFSLSLQAHSPPKVEGWLGAPGREQEAVDEIFAQGPAMGRIGQIPENRGPNDPPDPPHCGGLEVFLDAVRTGDASQIRSPYEDAVTSLAVVLAMNRSIESGQVEAIE
ncbi:Gfo/Idh/MocA family oxidoreductase [Chloroflexi bacterium TSY]|nr:Gfo/Idh/MocA family oxidoreductase [Chloroflexi bacterium TSY]